MKILFFYIGTPTPILETELELIRYHEKLGDTVRVIQCKGMLSNCFWNLRHKKSICFACRSKFKRGWEVLNSKNNVSLKELIPVYQKSNLALSPDFLSVADISAYEYDDEKIGLGATSSMVSITRDHRFNTKKHRKNVKRTLQASIEIYDYLKKEIKDFAPERVYFFNGRIHTQLPARLLCEKLKIDYFSYEVSLRKNHYVLMKNRTVHHPISKGKVDAVKKTWNKKKEAEGADILRKMRAGDPGGNQWIFLRKQQKNTLPKGFDYKKRNIVIFCGTLDEYEGIEWGTNKIYSPDQTAGIARILEAFEINDDFFFYVRVHPNMADLPRSTSQLSDIKKISLRFKNAFVIWPEEKVDSYALIEACEKVLTFGSTIGVEATFWGKPSILADHSLFENFDYAYRANSHGQIIKLLNSNLRAKHETTAIQAMYEITFGGSKRFKTYKERFRVNSQSVGSFDGVYIKARFLFRVWARLSRILEKLLLMIRMPSLLMKRIQILWR